MVTLIEVVSRFTCSVLNERFLILGEMVKPSLCSCMGNENAHIIIVHSTHQYNQYSSGQLHTWYRQGLIKRKGHATHARIGTHI